MSRLKGTGHGDETETKVLSRKELGRLLRKQAYEREKARRAKDPTFIAMKEAAKEQRRAAYRRMKEQRKAAREDLKEKESAKRAEERALADAELMKLMRCATKGSSAQN